MTPAQVGAGNGEFPGDMSETTSKQLVIPIFDIASRMAVCFELQVAA